MAKNKRRSDGRLQKKIYLGDGKYKYVYAHSQKELEQKAQAIKISMGKGLDLAADRNAFGEWADIWLDQKALEVSEKRLTSYAAAVRKFDILAQTPMSKLRTADIQKIINAEYASGKAKQTLEVYRMTIRQIFDLAISNRVTDYNIAASVKIPKGAAKETKRALTQEEQQWIISTPHRAQTAAMIMMYAGLRRGELLALTWKDIDLQTKTITVNKSVRMSRNRPEVKPGAKTAAGTRTVRIPQKLIDYLSEQQRDSLLVCPSAHGELMTEGAWKRLWQSYIYTLNKEHGDISADITPRPKGKPGPDKLPIAIPPITAHWLRHTYITMLYLSGVDVMTARDQAGHADIKTTMGIYTHLDAQFKNAQIDKLDDYLNGTENE